MTTIADERAARLAEQPLHVTGPKPGLAAGTLGTLRDVWAHRELLDMLRRGLPPKESAGDEDKVADRAEISRQAKTG